ncbi:MAG: RHS repeat-associated core domain-containing protein, partial [Patescibacteria group bacterium]
GLNYYRARYYDPQLKRFISEDPIGLEGGINVYAYVGNEPTNWIDPEGLKGIKGGRGRGKSRSGNFDWKRFFDDVDNWGSFGDCVWDFVRVCKKMTCDPPDFCPDPNAPPSKGPWIVNPDTKNCRCLEWGRELRCIGN